MLSAREWEPENRVCLACHYSLPLDMFYKAHKNSRRYICIICYEENRATPALLHMAKRISNMNHMRRKRNQALYSIRERYNAITT